MSIVQVVCPDGGHRLFYWVDTDNILNRWMVLRVSVTTIAKLITRKIDMSDVIPGMCEDDFVYFVDKDSDEKSILTKLTSIKDVPKEYVPSRGSEVDVDPTNFDYEILVGNPCPGPLPWEDVKKS